MVTSILRGPASHPKGSNDTYSLHADLHCKKYEAKFAMITYSCVVCSGLKVIHIVQKAKNTQCNESVLYNSRLVWTALKLPFLIIIFPRSNSLANKYHYTVTFDGIAPGPEGTEHLGCCSQVAVFERISSSVPTDESGIGQPYNLVQPLNIFTKPVALFS